MNSENDKPIRYLSASDLYNINNQIMEGDTLVRDLHLLNSAARRPAISVFGQVQFPTVTDKAAALLHSLAYHHLFIDGNKRTAVQAVKTFLALNGYQADWDPEQTYAYVLEIAQGKHDVEQISHWLGPLIRSVT